MGKFDTHGGYFAPQNYFKVNEGGSHGENPNGGVQIGTDEQGIPNMLEEGEPVYNDYVYSDNIKLDKKLCKEFNIPEKYAGRLYSEVADSLVDEASERPLDPISSNGIEAMLTRLASMQDEQKRRRDERNVKSAMNNLSPEELSQLMQIRDSVGDRTPSRGGMPVGTSAYQYTEQPQAEPVQPQPEMQRQAMLPQMMAFGGNLFRKFDDGTPGDVETYYIDPKTGETTAPAPTITLNPETGRGYVTGDHIPMRVDENGNLIDTIDASRKVAFPGATQAYVDAETSQFKKDVAQGRDNALYNGLVVLGDNTPLGLTGIGSVLGALGNYGLGDDKKGGVDLALSLPLVAGAKAKRAGKTAKEVGKKAVKVGEEVVNSLFVPWHFSRKVWNATKNAKPAIKYASRIATPLVELPLSFASGTANGSSMNNGTADWWNMLGKFYAPVQGVKDYHNDPVRSYVRNVKKNEESEDANTEDDPFVFNYEADGGSLQRQFATGGDTPPDADWTPKPMDEMTKAEVSDLLSAQWQANRLGTSVPLIYARLQRERAQKKANSDIPILPDLEIPEIEDPRISVDDGFRQLPNLTPVVPKMETPVSKKVLVSEIPSLDISNIEIPQITIDNGFKPMDSSFAVPRMQVPGSSVYPDSTTYRVDNQGNIIGDLDPATVTDKAQSMPTFDTRAVAPTVGLPSYISPALQRWRADQRMKKYAPVPETQGKLSSPPSVEPKEASLASLATAFGKPSSDYLQVRQDTLHLGDPAEERTPRNRKAAKSTSGRKYLSMFPRYAGAITNGVLGLYNAFQKPDHYDYQQYNPVLPTGRLSLQNPEYNPYDQNLGINALNAGRAGTNRTVLNSGQGPSLGAALTAADYTYGKNMGDYLTNVWNQNNAMRNNVITQRNQNAQAQANFDYGLNAARAYAINDARLRNMQNYQYTKRLNNAAESEKYAALQTQIDNMSKALSGIGQENYAMNQLNSNSAYDYKATPTGIQYYDPEYIGYLKKKNNKKTNG